jgi:hypothetical protein
MKAGDVQENVSKAIVGSDKSVALSHIEPFNLARQLDNARLFRYPAARQRRRARSARPVVIVIVRPRHNSANQPDSAEKPPPIGLKSREDAPKISRTRNIAGEIWPMVAKRSLWIS